jgi:hypothetical protein
MRFNRKLVLLLCAPFVFAGCDRDRSQASASPSPAASATSAAAAPSPSVAVVAAEIVEVDASGRTLTFRDRGAKGVKMPSPGEDRTLPVDPAALAVLDAMNPGDPIDVTCQMQMVIPSPHAPPIKVTDCMTVTGIVPLGSPSSGRSPSAGGRSPRS